MAEFFDTVPEPVAFAGRRAGLGQPAYRVYDPDRMVMGPGPGMRSSAGDHSHFNRAGDARLWGDGGIAFYMHYMQPVGR
ncbi:MAG: hypothetical protein OXT07_16180 [bacterium]|nr:hypothetical protein [bacterium]